LILELNSVEQAKSACEEVKIELKRQQRVLAAVIANAGITSMGPFEGIPFEELEPLMTTNVLGNMRVIHTLLPQIRADRSRVVVVGAPDIPLPQYVMKSACNGALLAFTRALRTDLFGLGVSVSLLQPAGTKGGMVLQAPGMIKGTRDRMSPELRQVYPPALKILRGGQDFGFDPVWAIWAADHAVTAEKPKTRYTTTPPGTFMYFVSFLLPDRLQELLLYKGPFGPGGAEVSFEKNEL